LAQALCFGVENVTPVGAGDSSGPLAQEKLQQVKNRVGVQHSAQHAVTDKWRGHRFVGGMDSWVVGWVCG
jgi:hypothetical protein